MSFSNKKLIELDLKHVWHPCAQMKDFENSKPLLVKAAQGSYIELASGKRIIDATSSWWCKSLGHNHPVLKQALMEQIDKFEHVIFANTTNETTINLSHKLAQFIPTLDKVFYASDGSSVVEIALKMSMHSRLIAGETNRSKFIALNNGYHGETLGALSVSDMGVFRAPFQSLLFDAHFISNIPYVTDRSQALWDNCTDFWPAIEKSLARYAYTATALILEPIIQGAGGMRIYSKDFLQKLCLWAQQNNIHIIADEIMTGIGRTGKWLACEHAEITPDFICLGKGLTSGWLPLSAVLTHNRIYEMFYDDYGAGKTFFHSHTHSGNALAASVALATLNIIEEDKLCRHVDTISKVMLKNMHTIANETGRLTNVRGFGAVVAADIIANDPNRRMGFEVSLEAIKLGALLRPLGNTIYWLPPLNIDSDTIEALKNITLKAIVAAFNS